MNHVVNNSNKKVEQDDDDVKVGVARATYYGDDYDDDDDDDDDNYDRYRAARLRRQVTAATILCSHDDDDDDVDDRKPPAKPRLDDEKKPFYQQSFSTLAQNESAKRAEEKAPTPVICDVVTSWSTGAKVDDHNNGDIEHGIVTSCMNSSSDVYGDTAKTKERNNGHQQRQQQYPGAQFARRLATGLSLDSILIRQVRQARENNTSNTDQMAAPGSNATSAILTAVVEQSPSASSSSQVKQPRYRISLVMLVSFCLVVMAIVMGIVLFMKSHHNSRHNKGGSKNMNCATTLFDPFSLDCSTNAAAVTSISQAAHPHVITQCYCQGKISNVPLDVKTRYEFLTETFVRSVAPDFHDTLESCSPRNQALVWLASGDGATATAATTTTTTMSTTTTTRTTSPATTVTISMLSKYTLAVLFLLWNGPSWTSNDGWMTSDDECSWFGITCGDDYGQVVDISLPNNNMTGTLSPIISLLTNLTSINLSGNNFINGSTIPREIRLLSNLQRLVLSHTGMQGTIPTELFHLGEMLKYVYINNNAISGTIPTLVGKLPNLVHWAAGINNLTGTIPTEFGRCTGLTILKIGVNHIHGTIPTQVGLMESIATFSVEDNKLTGTVPKEIGDCRYLQNLLLEDNHLHGTIPLALGSMSLLDTVDISGNHINGSTPKSLCKLPTCRGCICQN